MKLELKEQWNLIAEEITESAFALSDMKLLATGTRTTWGEIYLGIDPRGRRHVIVPVPDNAGEEREDTSQGISIEVRPYIVGGKEVLYCDIACKLEELNELFTVVAQDIIDHLLKQPDSSPFPQSLKILERWRQLLERVPARILSQEKISGLMGELLFLSKLADESPDVLDHWVGPDGASHDFISQNINVEVKTSARQVGRHIKVQSLEQMDISEDQQLYLFFVKLRTPTGTGITLPKMIDELLLNGVNSIDLYKKLLAAGYQPDEREVYLNRPLEFVEASFYRVDEDGFPRLTLASLRDGLPEGVGKISYEVNLDGTSIAPLSDDSIDELLKNMRQ